MANDDKPADQIQGESAAAADVPASTKGRGSFDVRSKRRGSGPTAKTYVVIGLFIAVFVAALIGFWTVLVGKMGESSSKIDETTVTADATLQVDRVADQSMAAAKEEKLRQQRAEEARAQRERDRQQSEQKKESAGAPVPAPDTPNRGSAPDPGPRPLTPAERKMAGGLIMSPRPPGLAGSGAAVAGSPGGDEGSSSGGPFKPLPQAEGQGDAAALGMGPRTRGSLSNLGGTSFAPTKAVMGPSRKYLLARRTYARCALYTEIVTEQPGLVECRLTDPIYSADGSTVLAEAGGKLFGEQNVEMKPGQARIFTAWTELEVQGGVRVPLNSLGAGPMGASGTEGWIDNHYRQRFGGAVLLTIMQDSLQSLSNLTQKSSGNGGYTINNTEQNVENMASQALQSSINIAPTGHLSPGTVLTVIVARDVDFSSVYENR